MESVVELKNVTKTYGKSRGVKNITFAVPTGSVFGFLGPNGAGKTTTISMLVDLIRPTSGAITIFGQDSQQDAVEIHKRIGFLAGDMALDRGLTGWQQLEYLSHLQGSFDKKYIIELAQRLDCKLDRKFKKLSRGNRQKVGLIAALMHKPELLILDEPTSGLDPLMQAEFNKLILEHKSRGGTTFISSHVLSEVQEICDTVTFIREGEIVATRTIAEITQEAPKLVVVHTDSRQLLTRLQKFSGLTVTAVQGRSLRGTFKGDINALLKLVSGYSLRNFTLQDADLEATFMRYYEGEDSHV